MMKKEKFIREERLMSLLNHLIKNYEYRSQEQNNDNYKRGLIEGTLSSFELIRDVLQEDSERDFPSYYLKNEGGVLND